MQKREFSQDENFSFVYDSKISLHTQFISNREKPEEEN